MEVIILILIIVFFVANGKKKPNKQAGQAQARAARGAAAANDRQQAGSPRAEAQPAREQTPANQLSRAEREERLRQLREKRAVRAQAAEPAQAFEDSLAELTMRLDMMGQGASHTDGEGCLGGSLQHDHKEGESREEHARHIAAMQARDAEEAVAGSRRGSLSLEDMRRAVVMAEVLGKPKAMRRG